MRYTHTENVHACVLQQKTADFTMVITPQKTLHSRARPRVHALGFLHWRGARIKDKIIPSVGQNVVPVRCIQPKKVKCTSVYPKGQTPTTVDCKQGEGEAVYRHVELVSRRGTCTCVSCAFFASSDRRYLHILLVFCLTGQRRRLVVRLTGSTTISAAAARRSPVVKRNLVRFRCWRSTPFVTREPCLLPSLVER